MSVGKQVGRIFSYLYRKYEFGLYQQVKHIRGTTKLYDLLRRLSVVGIEEIDETPEPIYEKEWDNLIILDSCRYDIFERVEEKSGYMISVAGCTPDFISRTFSNHDFSDTVLVTSNPHFSENIFEDLTERELKDVFHSVFHTYKTDWSEEEQTVLPESVAKDARTAEKLFPEKRKIIWFMQPHYPFIENPIAKGDKGVRPSLEVENDSAWQLAMNNKVKKEKCRKSYTENLKLVLSCAKNLARDFDGKTLITSDHGNFLGENNLYGHSLGDSQECLRKVPLIEFN